MDLPPKRRRADDRDEEQSLPNPRRVRLHDQQSDVQIIAQNEESYSLLKPPARAGRKHVGSSNLKSGLQFGTLVQKYILPNEYEHKPLSLKPEDDEIRLLVLRPGQPDHAIQCFFLVTSLSKVSNYEALSYYWGTEVADCLIKIENLSSKKNSSHLKKPSSRWPHPALVKPEKFYVRPNLYKALCQFRDEQRDIVLWIDALCINQDVRR